MSFKFYLKKFDLVYLDWILVIDCYLTVMSASFKSTLKAIYLWQKKSYEPKPIPVVYMETKEVKPIKPKKDIQSELDNFHYLVAKWQHPKMYDCPLYTSAEKTDVMGCCVSHIRTLLYAIREGGSTGTPLNDLIHLFEGEGPEVEVDIYNNLFEILNHLLKIGVLTMIYDKIKTPSQYCVNGIDDEMSPDAYNRQIKKLLSKIKDDQLPNQLTSIHLDRLLYSMDSAGMKGKSIIEIQDDMKNIGTLICQQIFDNCASLIMFCLQNDILYIV